MENSTPKHYAYAHIRAPERLLDRYAAGITKGGWDDETTKSMLIHDLPRKIARITPTQRRLALGNEPRRTKPHWDALIAAMAEYLAELHGDPVARWMNDPCRFLNETWMIPWSHRIAINAAAFSPPAFIRHGVIIDPRDLDGRGDEYRDWVPRRRKKAGP